ncbi:VOC family protein [Streptomyces sp. AC536]|uniref:VOC family protein n=1 Tax=Streptomyces buecherae TaxID=2763006 RepID=UPI00164D4BAA|nr:VOC family protein [Streptomyces buecherae]MBC3982543.1 VOC family protein [Streptomyces buecherae]QNJ41078.1 VOC family protein [Streptomyces buecherae]
MLTTHYVPGAPVWLDLGAPDTGAAAAFYGGVFGWEFQSAGPDAGGYGMLQLDGSTVAGLGPLMEEGASPAWTVYFQTADAEATARAVERAGGAVRAEPMDVFTAGRLAQFTDPTGADFAIWQPGDTRGIDAVNVPNTLCWSELHTTDAQAAVDFYRQVFGWEAERTPMAEVDYTVVSPPGGGRDAAHGGIMQFPPQVEVGDLRSQWYPYFEVEDCDVAVSAAVHHGGTALTATDDAPGLGRMSMVLDPFGAQFALITSEAG